MSWHTGVVDGVLVEKNYTDDLEADYWSTLADVVVLLGDRFNMTNGLCEPFKDSSELALSNALVTAGGAICSTNPFNGTWGALGGLPGGGYLIYSSTFVLNGYVYVAGGQYAATSYLTTFYRIPVSDFEAGTGTWEARQTLPIANLIGTAALVVDGYVCLLGGISGGTSTYLGGTKKMLIADFEAGSTTWTAGLALPTGSASARQVSAFVFDGYVYILGGVYSTATLLNSIHRITTTNFLSSGTWASIGTLPIAASGLSSFTIGDSVFILGGSVVASYSTILMKPIASFLAGTDSWVAAGSLLSSYALGYSTLLLNGKIYIVGGATSATDRVTTVFVQPETYLPAAVTCDSVAASGATLCRLFIKVLPIYTTATPDVGDTGTNKIEVYLSKDGNVTWSAAIPFFIEVDEIEAGAYLYDSGEISVEGATALGVKIQSFDRGGLSYFKMLSVILLWK